MVEASMDFGLHFEHSISKFPSGIKYNIRGLLFNPNG